MEAVVQVEVVDEYVVVMVAVGDFARWLCILDLEVELMEEGDDSVRRVEVHISKIQGSCIVLAV